MAHAGLDQPRPWHLQDAGWPVMADIIWFQTYVLWFIIVIPAFVLAVLAIIMFRLNARANPRLSGTTHYTPIEVIRTIEPVIILVVIAIPSSAAVYRPRRADTGPHRESDRQAVILDPMPFPDNGNSEFDSLIVQDKDSRLSRRSEDGSPNRDMRQPIGR